MPAVGRLWPSGDDDDDYDDDDGLLQSLIYYVHVVSPDQNLATNFSMFNPFFFRQESTAERQFFKILLFTLKSILLSARQSVVAGPQML